MSIDTKFGRKSCVLTWTPDICWSPSEDAWLHTAGFAAEGAAHPPSVLPGKIKNLQSGIDNMVICLKRLSYRNASNKKGCDKKKNLAK